RRFRAFHVKVSGLHVTATGVFRCVLCDNFQSVGYIHPICFLLVLLFQQHRKGGEKRPRAHFRHGQKGQRYAVSSSCPNDLKKSRSSLSWNTSRTCFMVSMMFCLAILSSS